MRDGFREIVSGWVLIIGLDELTDRIERAAVWTCANGPLEPDEQAMIRVMIEAQVARGMPDPAFVCPLCRRQSWHPRDAEERFCAVCGFVDPE